MPRLFRLASSIRLTAACTARVLAAAHHHSSVPRRLARHDGRAVSPRAVVIIITFAALASQWGVSEAQAYPAIGHVQRDRVTPPPMRVPALDSTGTVRGVITDSATREPVVGATISVNGGQRRAVTGPDGSYRIVGIPVGSATLEVRRLGYLPVSQRVTVAADDEMVADFRLAPAPRTLDQIVTTATGDQQRRQIGNIIATLQVDSVVRNAPVADLSQLLAGRAAGVQVFFSGGITGASPRINIRGQNSISLGTQPLLYVDGVRVENSTAGPVTTPAAAAATSGRFNDLDPADIESIEIVKGPSAATLYGTDAANGVVLVRTKRGAQGRAEWRVSGEVGGLAYDRNRYTPSSVPWGHSTTGASTPVRCPLLTVAAGTCVQDSVTWFSPLLDPETTPIGTGWRHAYRVQTAGGSASKYFLSASMEEEVGYLRMPDTDRELLSAQRGGRGLSDEELHPNAVTKYGMRANFTVPVAPFGDVAISTALLRQTAQIPNPTVLINGATSLGIRDQNDGWRGGFRPGDAFVRRHRENVTHFTGGVSAAWQAAPWLTGRVNAGVDFSSSYLDQLARAGEGFSSGALNGARDNTKVNVFLQTFDANATAATPLGASFTSRTSVGVQYNHRTALTNTAAAQQLTPGAETVAGGAIPVVREATVETVVAGAYGEQTLGFRERLFLTGALRVDGGSAFGQGFKAAVYPKASVSWLLSDEPFWPSIPGLASLRLRAAYGQSGVQPGAVAALASETLFAAFVDGAATTGAGLGAVGNRNLKPERQRELEGGVDVELLAGRLALEATYYDKRSTDALVTVPLPASFGGGSRWQNVGAVRNRGWEALINARLLDMARLSWTVTLNGSVNDNTVLAIAPGITAQYGAGRPGIVRGYPLFSYFEYPILGYEDRNGNGIIEVDEVTVGASRTYAGRSYPRTQLGAATVISTWNGRLQLNAMVDHRGGFRMYNGVSGLRCFYDACAATAMPGAPLAQQAAAVAWKSPQLRQTISGFIEDASFTRFRELALTYTLPPALSRRFRASTATVTLAGRNLALWTRYTGADPEVQSSQLGSSNDGASFDQGGIPPATYWLLRINLGF